MRINWDAFNSELNRWNASLGEHKLTVETITLKIEVEIFSRMLPSGTIKFECHPARSDNHIKSCLDMILMFASFGASMYRQEIVKEAGHAIRDELSALVFQVSKKERTLAEVFAREHKEGENLYPKHNAYSPLNMFLYEEETTAKRIMDVIKLQHFITRGENESEKRENKNLPGANAGMRAVS